MSFVARLWSNGCLFVSLLVSSFCFRTCHFEGLSRQLNGLQGNRPSILRALALGPKIGRHCCIWLTWLGEGATIPIFELSTCALLSMRSLLFWIRAFWGRQQERQHLRVCKPQNLWDQKSQQADLHSDVQSSLFLRSFGLKVGRWPSGSFQRHRHRRRGSVRTRMTASEEFQKMCRKMGRFQIQIGDQTKTMMNIKW